jgi:hypothetical protein
VDVQHPGVATPAAQVESTSQRFRRVATILVIASGTENRHPPFIHLIFSHFAAFTGVPG